MTEREAEALVARLGRVWILKNTCSSPRHETGLHHFDFFWEIADQTFFLFAVFKPRPHIVHFSLEWRNCELEYEDGCISSSSIETVEQWAESVDNFTAQWMPYFRRGCWLSGCPIEASAHEKMEWTQGFSREEIELWNLRF